MAKTKTLRDAMRDRDRPLTLRDLAAKTKYSLVHLSEVFAGKRAPGPKMVAALAKALGLERREIEARSARAQRAHAEASGA